ncbi:MAG: sigma 54-interacting transcriptional regulator [Oscillospiraceae bacterium]|jgi:transcriptional regulator with PAS, ATPase and Fis domain|nr:sigma 54-interacting transcriptional regulator [Oscillospiraceae bacterium]
MQKLENHEKWAGLHRGEADQALQSADLIDAWKRSDSRNIDFERALPKELTQGELERSKKTYRRLLICSDWVINHFIANTTENALRVLLFSKEGILLKVYGAASEDDWLSQSEIGSGTKWSEETIGTNPFSLGIQTRKAVELPGYMNYSRFLIDGSYYFAPICLTENEVYGSIVVAIPQEKSNHYLLSIAITLARSIELDIFLFQNIGMFTSSDEEQGSIFLRQNKGRNEVVIINDQVFKILGIKKPDTYHLTLEEIILSPPDNREFWSMLEAKKVVSDKIIPLSVSSGRVFVNMSIATYKQNKFHPDGITISISPNGRANRMSSKFTDNNARFTFNDVIGENELMLETIKRSKIAALSDSNILIQGESGVGKDDFAQAIHNASKRSHKPFVAINCAAFSKELIASELFGYESGAFTGAKREGSIGKFELANHGTLFLDEIGDIPMEVQSVLLRVLEEKTFRKVGGNDLIEVDVRIIAASNKNLKELIEKALFREDLFYRLSIIRINIPPLKNRGADVYLFAEYFIRKLCARMDKPDIRLTKTALDFLGRYSWPGNIRELQNLLEGIISTHEETLIGEKEIQNYLGDYFLETMPEERPAAPIPFDIYGLDEREKFEMALRKCRNNRTKAAEYLGLSRSTFYRRMQEFGMS